MATKMYHSYGSSLRFRLSSSSPANTAQQIERMSNNVSRIYARRMMEMAAVSAAAWKMANQNYTQMEQRMTGSVPTKPNEWKTVDLIEQRKQILQSISTLGKTKVERVLHAGQRILNLCVLAAPLALLVPAAYLGGPKSKSSDYAWNYAIWSIEKAGPTFVKLCQWATTRNDLFPADFVSKFSKLQDDTIGHNWSDTEKILKDSFGEHYDSLLEFENIPHIRHAIAAKRGAKHFSTKEKFVPIGSGCIAQVYKAKLKKDTQLYPSGTEVAVKVTHPNIVHKVCVDFYILNKLTSFLERIPYINLDYLSLKDSTQQFLDIMIPQMDLRCEARNLKRFRRDFAGNEKVGFPAPISELTTNQVLVESFIHGEPILDWIKENRSTEEERQEVATIGLATVMEMIFLHDFVHGDLHPGNIIISRNSKVRGKPVRLNMIDCGLVVEMGEQDHEGLVKILGALIKKDGELAGQLMVDTAKKCQASALDVQLFCKGIQTICKDDEDNNFLESVGDYLSDICYLACRHKVKLEASFINAALACEIMEGIASTLYPTMQVQSIAFPMVIKAEMMHGLKQMKLF
jgi:aarF domain-containing kinase